MSLAWEWGSSFVLHFILTEISNIGQNLFLLSSRSKLFGGEVAIGVTSVLLLLLHLLQSARVLAKFLGLCVYFVDMITFRNYFLQN